MLLVYLNFSKYFVQDCSTSTMHVFFKEMTMHMLLKTAIRDSFLNHFYLYINYSLNDILEAEASKDERWTMWFVSNSLIDSLEPILILFFSLALRGSSQDLFLFHFGKNFQVLFSVWNYVSKSPCMLVEIKFSLQHDLCA